MSANTGAGTIGVLVTDGASPTISNCSILGGAPGGAAATAIMGGAASRALVIASGSAEVTHDDINGGYGVAPSGTLDGVGSAAIHVTGGTPHIHENAISAGSGSGTWGSIGIWTGADLSGASVVERNVIDGGTGHGDGGEGSEGLRVVGGGAVELVANTIDGGSGTGSGQSLSVGVYADVAATLRVVGNRIDAGTAADAVYALFNDGDVTLENNLIYANGSASTFGAGVVSFGTVHAAHNTIVAETRPLWQHGNAMTFENNIFASPRATADAGWWMDSCATTMSLRFRNNLWIGVDHLLVENCNGATNQASTLADFESQLSARTKQPSDVGDNVVMRAACDDGGAGCIATCSSDVTTCLQGLFAQWTTYGRDQLSVARPTTGAPSLGAQQYGAQCPP
jgi:hypothetical protein